MWDRTLYRFTRRDDVCHTNTHRHIHSYIQDMKIWVILKIQMLRKIVLCLYGK